MVVSTLPLELNSVETRDLQVSFLKLFRKKEEELKIKVPVPPPPPPPGFEPQYGPPPGISPAVHPQSDLTPPELKPERPLRPEPSPWQWF